jgi:hypothetical protein
VAGSPGTVVGGAAGASLKLRRNALRVWSLIVGFPLRQGRSVAGASDIEPPDVLIVSLRRGAGSAESPDRRLLRRVLALGRALSCSRGVDRSCTRGTPGDLLVHRIAS